MSKLLGIVKYVEYVIIVIVVVLLVVMVTPTALGYQTKTIISPSMQPTIKVGDIVVINPEEKPSIGEVVVFNPEMGEGTGTVKENQVTITHRLIRKEITNKGIKLVTKGDNNNTEDSKIQPQQVQGVVDWVIPKLGYFHLYRTQFMVGIISILIVLTLLEMMIYKNERNKDEKTK